MNFPLYIAKRYLVSKSKQSTVNIINRITFFVIVVGAAALLVVLSGFAGLKEFSLSFTTQYDPDLKLRPASSKFLQIDAAQEAQLTQIEGLAAYSKFLEERVYLGFREKHYASGFICGVDTNYNRVVPIDSAMYFGTWINNSLDQVVVGMGIMDALGIGLHRDPIKIVVPKLGKGSLSRSSKLFNQELLTVGGVYNINDDIDKKYLFAELDIAQKLLEKKSGTISGLLIRLEPGADEGEVITQLEQIFPNQEVRVRNRESQNEALYKMLNSENLAIYLIFTLVLIIALFNLAGAIIMLILDKQDNARTLYYIGTTVKELRQIYFLQGLLVTIAGGALGILIALLLVYSQQVFSWFYIGANIPFPVAIRGANVLLVFATILCLGFIASKIAASRINDKLLRA
ncbi:MAG: ABC transporter permease [Flavobacteriaceae bacterium]|nr:ABC transporter permease [Flavobacteriaceae bacterium]